jgi:hypothetical protein
MIAAGSASAQQVRWRASGSFTASHSTTIAMETFKSEVLRLTKNAVQVDLFPGNTLGGGFEQVDQLRTGQIEMAWGGLSFYDKLLPELGAVNLPFAATSANQAICEIEGDLGKYIEEKMAEKGVLLLGWGQIGARHVTNNKRPIKTVDDLKGLKIRTPSGDAWTLTFKGRRRESDPDRHFGTLPRAAAGRRRRTGKSVRQHAGAQVLSGAEVSLEHRALLRLVRLHGEQGGLRKAHAGPAEGRSRCDVFGDRDPARDLRAREQDGLARA